MNEWEHNMVLYKLVNGKRVKIESVETSRIEEEWAANAAAKELDIAQNGYKKERAKMYKDTTEYLDMIWHAIDNGIVLDKQSEFYIDRKAVKDEYPKPE